MENKLDNETGSQVSRRLSHIQSTIKRGNQVIDLILNNLRNQDVGEKSFSTHRASEIVSMAITDYAYSTDKERSYVELKKADDFKFRVAENLFVYVIFNLLKNSIYYLKIKGDSDDGAKIKVSLKSGEKYNYIFFKDYGPGIEQNKIPTIFQPFSTSGKAEGTGLGLPFCKRAMESFGGDVICDSELGSWTVFSLMFPIIKE